MQTSKLVCKLGVFFIDFGDSSAFHFFLQLPVVSGAAREQRQRFEKGEVHIQTKKLIDEEDLNVTSGSAREQRQRFEAGEVTSGTKKMIDEEDFGFSSGSTQQQRHKFESGELVSKPEKMIDKEDLNVSIGKTSEQKYVFESDVSIQPTKVIEEEGFGGTEPRPPINDEELPGSTNETIVNGD